MALLTWCSLHGLPRLRPVPHPFGRSHLHPKLVSDPMIKICLPCEFGVPSTVNVNIVFSTSCHLQMIAYALVVSEIVALPRNADTIVVRLKIQVAHSAHNCVVCVCDREREREEGMRRGEEEGGDLLLTWPQIAVTSQMGDNLFTNIIREFPYKIIICPWGGRRWVNEHALNSLQC